MKRWEKSGDSNAKLSVRIFPKRRAALQITSRPRLLAGRTKWHNRAQPFAVFKYRNARQNYTVSDRLRLAADFCKAGARFSRLQKRFIFNDIHSLIYF